MKKKSVYVCSQCSHETYKWMGKCPNCGEWNTLNEQEVVIKNSSSKVVNISTSSIKTYILDEIDERDEYRYKTGISELDRVLGGGIVKGSLILLSGEPGTGKSTILLQICNYISNNLRVFYVSGEESIRQIKLRAKRINIKSDNLILASESNILNIIHTIKNQMPDVVIIDSIQTMNLETCPSLTGSVTQVKECTNILMNVAKSNEIPIFIVGHVNKEGSIAGPKILEHMVDTVLYFEGEKNLSYRILRATKNRYGSTNEIGVFDMTVEGLIEITNPSEMFLNGKPKNVSGSSVVCFMEGTRPILAEVQALVSKTTFPSPRRASAGFDYNRVNLLLAVLEKRCGYFLGNLDVYINVVGGLKLYEPSVDLSVCLSIVSSLIDKNIDENIISFGEVGLTGEIRSVMNALDRIMEAERLGFSTCILPYYNLQKMSTDNIKIKLIGVKSLNEVFYYLGF